MDRVIEQIYNNIIEANAKLHNLDIDDILQKLLDHFSDDFNAELPIFDPEELDVNQIMVGLDDQFYIVKENDEGKYWTKLVQE
jgi:hypothetical protein